MTRLTWDRREYEAGVDRGVVALADGSCVPWSGLTSVSESPESNDRVTYLDGARLAPKRNDDPLSGTISAYSYPDGFYENVLLQKRARFDLAYRTMTAESYKIHIVYNVLLSPAGYGYQQNDTEVYTWGFTTTPVPVDGVIATSHVIVDGTKAYSWTVQAFEDVLYGTPEFGARIPRPDEIVSIFDDNSVLKVTDHGDGSFTVEGPDSVVSMIDATTFQIDWESAVYIDANIYQLSSL